MGLPTLFQGGFGSDLAKGLGQGLGSVGDSVWPRGWQRVQGQGLVLGTGMGHACDGIQDRLWDGNRDMDQAQVWDHGLGTHFTMCFGRARDLFSHTVLEKDGLGAWKKLLNRVPGQGLGHGMGPQLRNC